MSGALALRSDVPSTLADQMQLAQALAKSGLLPDHLRGKPENILAIMYAAQSVDVPVWQAIQGMQVISGKVGMAADLHRALILRAGHIFRVTDSTDTSATVVVIRRDDPDRFEHRATFSKADAERASLWGKGGWKSYPKAMLVARATTLVARNACSDVIAGMAYTAEELGADVDEDGRVVQETPAGSVEGKPAPSREPIDSAKAERVARLSQVRTLLSQVMGKPATWKQVEESYAREMGGLIIADASLDEIDIFAEVLRSLAEDTTLVTAADEAQA